MCAFRCTLVNLEDNNKEILAPFSRNCCELVIPDVNAKLFRGSLGFEKDTQFDGDIWCTFLRKETKDPGTVLLLSLEP